MKREIGAALLLCLLLGLSLYNLHYYDALTDSVEAELSLSRSCADSGDFSGAREHAQQALGLWQDADAFTHIFIRHPEIDGLADAFYDLLQHLDEKNAEAAASAYERLNYHLDCVDEMEHPRLGSVF